jgi:transcriptional regulator with XRE-family HTH domain
MIHGDNDEDLDRRELDPTYTRGYVHIAHLRDKLPWLYSLHPSVESQKNLARALRVSQAQLSNWLNGTRYSDSRTIASVNPDSIPIKHYRSFLDIWGLPAEILEMEDLVEFRSTIEHFEGGRSAWEKLVRAVLDDDSIEIIPENATRGLIDPDEEEEAGIPHYCVGDRVMLRVANLGYRHGVMLEQDRSVWVSLQPNSRRRDTILTGPMIFPRQRPEGPPRFARLEGAGLHRVLVILTDEALPASVLELFISPPIDTGSLNYAATVLQNRLAAGPDKCRLLSQRFLASTKTSA